jgi:predicted transcriptional regulator
MLGVLVDPSVYSVLLELENGNKELSYLTEKLGISYTEIQKKLSCVIEYGFVKIKKDGDKTIFAVDKEKLNKIMESDENFSGVVEGLTELDSFLN